VMWRGIRYSKITGASGDLVANSEPPTVPIRSRNHDPVIK
jgi:hypothetical protein